MTIKDLINDDNCPQMTGRLRNILMKNYRDTSLDEITESDFMKQRNAGEMGWEEFEKLRDSLGIKEKVIEPKDYRRIEISVQSLKEIIEATVRKVIDEKFNH